jgi:hypothetical protein
MGTGGPLFMCWLFQWGKSVDVLRSRPKITVAVLVGIAVLHFGLRYPGGADFRYWTDGATDATMLGFVWDKSTGTAAIWRGGRVSGLVNFIEGIVGIISLSGPLMAVLHICWPITADPR